MTMRTKATSHCGHSRPYSIFCTLHQSLPEVALVHDVEAIDNGILQSRVKERMRLDNAHW